MGTTAEAIEYAIADLRKDGGGELWLHRAECSGDLDDDDCPCNPYCIEVNGAES